MQKKAMGCVLLFVLRNPSLIALQHPHIIFPFFSNPVFSPNFLDKSSLPLSLYLPIDAPHQFFNSPAVQSLQSDNVLQLECSANAKIPRQLLTSQTSFANPRLAPSMLR